MKVHFLPQTKVGKWASGLVILWPALTILGSVIANKVYQGVEAGNGIIDDIRIRPLLSVTMLFGIVSGIISFPISLIAIFRKGERSILIFPSALIGLFLIILLVGEILFEH